MQKKNRSILFHLFFRVPWFYIADLYFRKKLRVLESCFFAEQTKALNQKNRTIEILLCFCQAFVEKEKRGKENWIWNQSTTVSNNLGNRQRFIYFFFFFNLIISLIKETGVRLESRILIQVFNMYDVKGKLERDVMSVVELRMFWLMLVWQKPGSVVVDVGLSV